MAAITAAENGNRVVLIERNLQLGRKVLATGNGRCNLTNRCADVDRYHGSTPTFITAVLSQFDQDATLRFFADLGLVTKEEENGRIFPRTNQASSVVEIMSLRLLRDRVAILTNAQVVLIEQDDAWQITIKDRETVTANQLIIATGGRAAHYLGSTGDGLYWAQKLGHKLTPIHAALVPIETIETWPKRVQGTKICAGTYSECDGHTIDRGVGDLLFTAYGISGPACMSLARGIAPLLSGSSPRIHIDLLPEVSAKSLLLLIDKLMADTSKTAAEALVGLLPSSVIPITLGFAEIRPEAPSASVSADCRSRLCRTLKDVVLTVSRVRPLKEAQVTAGGIDCSEVDPATLRSRLVSNLFFAGEILDVDGDSGGFNLQWAWSSGRVAGTLGASHNR